MAEVKARIEALTGLPACCMKLGINSKVTRDYELISCYGWKPNDSIVMVVSNAGIYQSWAAAPAASSRDHAQETPECGYLQIDDYALKHRQSKRGIAPGPKRWVPLPQNAQVHGHARSRDNAAQTLLCSSLAPRSCSRSARKESACSTPRSMSSDSSESTVATMEDHRHVYFRDGTRAGSDTAAEADTGVPLAEWIYVDRDICGFSLYEYAPHHEHYKDFASSPYAREFLEELSNMESVNDYHQRKMAACEMSSEEYRREVDELDRALMFAGVSTVLLQ